MGNKNLCEHHDYCLAKIYEVGFPVIKKFMIVLFCKNCGKSLVKFKKIEMDIKCMKDLMEDIEGYETADNKVKERLLEARKFAKLRIDNEAKRIAPSLIKEEKKEDVNGIQ